MRQIILASKSQTRARILKEFGIPFEQVGVDFDEDSLDIDNPKDFVYHATKGKFESYMSLNGEKLPVLCADTVVTAHGEILRKAKDREDAYNILQKQSGGSVGIITCMMYKADSLYLCDISSTEYIFDIFDEKKLEEYLKSDEWKDKAGACMVEGFCKQFIKDIRGLQSTAMGLSVEKLIPFLV